VGWQRLGIFLLPAVFLVTVGYFEVGVSTPAHPHRYLSRLSTCVKRQWSDPGLRSHVSLMHVCVIADQLSTEDGGGDGRRSVPTSVTSKGAMLLPDKRRMSFPFDLITPAKRVPNRLSLCQTQSRNSTILVEMPCSQTLALRAGIKVAPCSACILVAHCVSIATAKSRMAATFCSVVRICSRTGSLRDEGKAVPGSQSASPYVF
jgi:hypothetical protein